MTRYVNKRMALVINRMCWRLAGGLEPMGDNNIREGSSLGFIDGIHRNEIFGQKLYPSIHHQAAAYMYHIIKGHVFNDGNKRAGLAVALTFLRWNGVRFPTLSEEDSYAFVIEVASSTEPASEMIEKIAAWFQELAEKP